MCGWESVVPKVYMCWDEMGYGDKRKFLHIRLLPFCFCYANSIFDYVFMLCFYFSPAWTKSFCLVFIPRKKHVNPHNRSVHDVLTGKRKVC